MAAGILLVREAGGFVDRRRPAGNAMFETGSIVAGNQTVHKALLAVLAGAGRDRPERHARAAGQASKTAPKTRR